MRFLLPYFLLFIFCLSSTELAEFLKFPLLITHYIEHKNVKHELSFHDFLNDHYSQDDDGDNDQSKDKKLPFKSTDSYNFIHVKVSKISTSFYFLICVFKTCVQICIIDCCTKLPAASLNKLFQPPRLKS